MAQGGITVTEAVGADQPIVRLPTATTGFVGRALRGPVNRAVRVRNFSEYQQVFGGLWQPSMLSYAVEQYFDNGGREAVVVRVVNGGAPATISLPCGDSTLVLEALSPGSREVLRASIDYDNIAPNEEDRFNLVVQRVRSLGSEHIEDQEIFRRLSIEPGTTRFIVAALQESQLVRVRGAVPAVRPERTFRPGARHPIGYVDSNPDGDDGSPLTDYDLIGSAERGTGLFALRGIDDLHFLCVPPPARDRDIGPGVLLVAAQFCRDHRALLVVDPPAAWQTSEDALHGLRDLSFQSDSAFICFPRVQAFDRLRGRYEPFANSGSVAGALARMDAHRSPWDGLPDEQILLRPGTRPLQLLTDADCQRLTTQGINPLHSVRAERCQRRAPQDARAWLGQRPRKCAAHVPSPAVADDHQHRERHALGALRRPRSQHLAAPRATGPHLPARACGQRRFRQGRGHAALRSRLRRARQHDRRPAQRRGALPGFAACVAQRRVPLVHADPSARGQHRAVGEAAATATRHALHHP